jgi:hypothetical protein
MAPSFKTRIPTVLPLQSGDRLTRTEFERRYDAMPENIKAELLDGVVLMSSPVRADFHGEQHGSLVWWTQSYKIATPGVRAPDNATLRLDDSNEPQPDAVLCLTAEMGGQTVIDKQGYLASAPEWVGEITASTASYDLHLKKNVYGRFGVREYLAWRVFDQEIDWFVLRRGHYERLASVRGVYKSTIFPGLWLHIRAMLEGDLAKVLAVLNRGLATPEHAAFVEQLHKRRS